MLFMAYRFNDYFCVLNEKETMNKEKNRKLSPKEQRRLNVSQSASEEILVYDHPTQAGSVIFEK